MLARAALLLLALLALGGAAQRPADAPRVLVFSHSTGFRHASIEPGVAALKALGARRGYAVVASEDPDVFSADGLRGVDAVVLLSTTTKPDDPASEWLAGPRRAAFQAFVRRGGGVLGIHAAADSHYHWPWYGRMIGGRFRRHPAGTPSGVVTLTEPRHPATRGLVGPVRRTDEWYYFKDRSAGPRVVATLSSASIGERDDDPNPVAWAHEFEGGRVFYTAMGHTPESYAEPWFLAHLEGGLDWVLRRR